ncbi:hypothetical protein [Streptomyces sp. NBC_00076]|uniref:hypothetical protein n=1 Tax=Streptomyces sp. NBC_00076 TaxID=2975642 RepID=UPI00324E6FC0
MQAPTLEVLHDPAASETLVRGSSTRGVVRRMLTWLGRFGDVGFEREAVTHWAYDNLPRREASGRAAQCSRT